MTAAPTHDEPTLLKTSEVAKMCRVDSRTVLRWVDEGRLDATKIFTGHYRYERAKVLALLHGEPPEAVGQ